MKMNRMQLMSEGNVSKALFKLGIPMVVSMLVTAIYNVVDAYFVSGLGTQEAGAVSVAFPLSLIFSGIGLTFGVGAGSYISRLLGNYIGQIMTSKSPVRSAEDIDETALSYAEIKAFCTGNPHIKEKMDLDIDVQRLKLLKANHLSQRYALEDQIIKYLPQKAASLEQRIEGYTADMNQLKENTHPNEDGFSPMEVEGTVYTDKKAAGSAILAACHAMTSPDPVPLGQYRGFAMELSFESFSKEYRITLKGALTHTTGLGTDIFGNILRLDNLLGGMEERLIACREQLENVNVQLENAKQEVEKPFPQEDELKTKSARLDELNIP